MLASDRFPSARCPLDSGTDSEVMSRHFPVGKIAVTMFPEHFISSLNPKCFKGWWFKLKSRPDLVIFLLIVDEMVKTACARSESQ